MPIRSTFAGLNTVVRGLNTNKVALDTVGHNISNASTSGYSRQSVNQAAMAPSATYSTFGKVYIGNGNDALSITRARDIYADKQFWKDSADKAYYTDQAKNYDKIEAIFDDSGDSGIVNAMQKFYQAWSDLSTTASTSSSRTAVVEQGKVLSDRMKTAATQVKDQITSEYNEMQIAVDGVNTLTAQIASLNQSIMFAETAGATANDLRDERDLLVDELSEYVNINVYEDGDTHMYTVVSNGASLVNGISTLTLKMDGPVNNPTYGVNEYNIMIKETDTAFMPQSGTLQALKDAIAEDKGYVDALANMSTFLLTTFNDLHKTGYGTSSVTTDDIDKANGLTEAEYGKGEQINFYGGDGKTYKLVNTGEGKYAVIQNEGKADEKTLTGLEIIQALTVNGKLAETDGERYVATRQAGNGTADGSLAVELSCLINQGDTSRKEGECAISINSLQNYYNKTMTALGVNAEACDNNVKAQEDILEQVKTWRDSVSGVNWDEELSNMIMFQQGYMACSRCINTLDEMLDKLINSTGMVGR